MLDWTVPVVATAFAVIFALAVPPTDGHAQAITRALSSGEENPTPAEEVVARAIPPQCEDNVDLDWRCYIASSSEVAQVLQTLEDDCFDTLTLNVAPWRVGPMEADGSAYVVEYLVTGRRSGAVCP